MHVAESRGQLGLSHGCVLKNTGGQNHECVDSWDPLAGKLLGGQEWSALVITISLASANIEPELGSCSGEDGASASCA